MALQTRKKITIEGESVINGVVVQGYRAEISTSNPENVQMSEWIADQNGYKANRVQARKDNSEFEDLVYSIQDELITAANNTEAE
jgi:hypothetical protein